MESTQDWELPTTTMPKSTYKARLENIAQAGRYTDKDLAEYFDINEKSFYNIKKGITVRPRKPFADKLKALESSLINAGSKHTETDTKHSSAEKLTDSSSLLSKREDDTNLRMYYFKVLFPSLNDDSQKKLMKLLHDMVYRKKDTTLEAQMKKDLGLF